MAADRAKAGGPPEAEAQARGLLGTFQSQMYTANTAQASSAASINEVSTVANKRSAKRLAGHPRWSPDPPVDTPTDARVDFDWCNVQAEALVRNVELRKTKWAIKSIELEIMSAKNQLLPQLDVTGIYRWVGVGDVLAKTERTGIQFPTLVLALGNH